MERQYIGHEEFEAIHGPPLQKEGAACIQVHGAGQAGPALKIISDRDCRIWCGQMILVTGCHSVNPVTGSDTGMDRYVASRDSLDLKAGVPVDLQIAQPIMLEGLYRNAAQSPPDGAMLFSGGESWPGYEADWMIRARQAENAAIG